MLASLQGMILANAFAILRVELTLGCGCVLCACEDIRQKRRKWWIWVFPTVKPWDTMSKFASALCPALSLFLVTSVPFRPINWHQLTTSFSNLRLSAQLYCNRAAVQARLHKPDAALQETWTTMKVCREGKQEDPRTSKVCVLKFAEFI